MKTITLVLCLLISCAFGQTAPKKGVKFVCTCNDSVGARYATAVRDLIAASPRYTSADDFIENPGPSSIPHMGIRVVSLDPQVGSPGNGAALAVVITWGTFYLTSSLQICTSENVRTCAENTIALLDSNAIS